MRTFTIQELKDIAIAIFMKDQYPPKFWLDAWEDSDPVWEYWVPENVRRVQDHPLPNVDALYSFDVDGDIGEVLIAVFDSPKRGPYTKQVQCFWVDGELEFQFVQDTPPATLREVLATTTIKMSFPKL